MDSARLAELSALAFEGTDQVFGTPARMALGFPIGRKRRPPRRTPAFGGRAGAELRLRGPRAGGRLRLDENRLVPNFDTALSVTTILADHLAGPLSFPRRAGDEFPTITRRNATHTADDSTAPRPASVRFLPRRQPDAVGGDGVGTAPDPEVPAVHGALGRPPARDTVLAIWALGAMWFTTGDNEQKAKNLSRQPAVRADDRNGHPDGHGLRHRRRRRPGHRAGRQGKQRRPFFEEATAGS